MGVNSVGGALRVVGARLRLCADELIRRAVNGVKTREGDKARATEYANGQCDFKGNQWQIGSKEACANT